MLIYPDEQALLYFNTYVCFYVVLKASSRTERKAVPSACLLAMQVFLILYVQASLLPSSSYRELLFRCLEPITFELCGLNFVHSLSISSQQETSKKARKLNEIDQSKGGSLGDLAVKSRPNRPKRGFPKRTPLNVCRGRMNERLLSLVPWFLCRLHMFVLHVKTCTMASSYSSSSSSGKDSKSEATTKRGHYGNYLSQPNTKIPKTTFYRILNKSKMRSEENPTCARENVLPDSKDPETNVFESLQNELNCLKHAQLSSFVNDNPEILDASGIPSCSRPSHLESEVPRPTSLGLSEFQQPNGGNEGLYVKGTNTTLYEECEILKPTNTATTSIADNVIPWNFSEDDPALFDIRPAITFAADEEECLDDIWTFEEDSETSDRSDMGFENTSKESDTSGTPLFEGARLTLGVSMLLVITFAMRHSITGVALADLLLLIEVHLISPNYFGQSMKLLRDFFKRLKNPIEFHYYCSFCYEYIGAKRHPEHCTNKHCLQDFSKKGSLAYFIVVPIINQLQSLLASKYQRKCHLR